MRFRAVFDMMVCLQAAANGEGASGACLRSAELDDVELIVSPAITAELRDVMTRPKIQKKFPSLTPQLLRQFFRRLAGCSTIIAFIPHIVSLPRDPKDEKYINLAIASDARYLVTRDRDLLDLMSLTDETSVHFRAAYPTIAIVEPAMFLDRLKTP
jgi:putative PIN family toxin of toxin-antitoxin system